MKKIYLLLAYIILLVIFSGCAGSKALKTDQLSGAEYFQKAYEATDKNDYALAISYYQAFQTNFPDDKERNVWAEYEIAFAYYKMKNNQKALELFDALLAKYEGEDASSLPPGPKTLAERIKAKILAEKK